MEHNLSLYRIFYTTAKTGNISRAADELFISQPAISKAIKKLEENLEVKLFTRNSRGVQLTEEGELLLTHVHSAFQSLAVGEEQMKNISELGIGHLRIGASTTLCKHVLLSYLKPFIEKHPHVRISIRCQSTNKTLELLEGQSIDIGLISRPLNSKEIEFYSLGEIEDIFVATATYMENLKLREQARQADILETATVILLDQENMTRQYINDYFSKNHIYPTNILEITTMDLLIDFAKIGLGAACVIKEFVREELQQGLLEQIPLAAPIHKREIGFAHKKNTDLPQAVLDFISFYTAGENQLIFIV